MLTQAQKQQHSKAIGFANTFYTLFPAIIAGGAARDILLGESPKYYDLWLFKDESISDILDGLKEIRKAYCQQGFDPTISVDEILDDNGKYNGETDRNVIKFVIRVEFDGVKFDVIKLDRKLGHSIGAMDVLESFDFPLNQFLFLPDGNIVGIGHMQQDQHALRELRDGRIEHLNQKFPDFAFINLH